MVRFTELAVAIALLQMVMAGASVSPAGTERVPAEIRACYETTDGASVQVFRCVGGNEGGVRSSLDPFLVFDAYRATNRAALGTGAGFPAHPHRGFTELRYLLAGALNHTDSCGTRGAVTHAGGAQVFFAGAGAAHEEAVLVDEALEKQRPGGDGDQQEEEATSKRGFLFEGFQLWFNEPRATKMQRPRHAVVPRAAFPVVEVRGRLPERRITAPHWKPPVAAKLRVLAGRFGGKDGPLSEHLPDGALLLDIFHLSRSATQPVVVAVPPGNHVLLYVYRGSVLVGPPARLPPLTAAAAARQDSSRAAAEEEADSFTPSQTFTFDVVDIGQDVVDEAQFAALGPGHSVTLSAAATADGSKVEDAACLLVTAPRVREPVFVGSGFAMGSREDLDAAVADLKAGRAADCGAE